jgi:glucosamine--fructose-6-phosphate aminotransferase (isomerizing)
MSQRGLTTAAEIEQQPEVLAALLQDGLPQVRAVATQITADPPRFVLLAGRGTSDNAALYAKYLLEIRLGLPVGLVSPSTTTLYSARQRLDDVLVVAVSQSGASPDLVEVIEAARRSGAQTLAITNEAGSPLAQVSSLHLDVMAGPEKAIPATKSYTAQLFALWLLVDAWRGGDAALAASIPGLASQVLSRSREVDAIADRLRFADHLVVTGRGYASATAREAALKVMETAFLSTHAWSAADLLHGPFAMLHERTPCLAVVPEGPGGDAMRPVLQALADRRIDLTVIGDALGVPAATTFALPAGVEESLSPVLQILPLQLLAHRVALARGYDPDRPPGLSKVTRTR